MKRIVIILTLFIPVALLANANKKQSFTSEKLSLISTSTETDRTAEYKKMTTSVEVQNLFTTHGTNFNGIGVVESYMLSPRFALGLGAEYSWCDYHFDNGWNLTNLKFLPVYIDSKVNLTSGKKLTPFLRLSTGVSFANYNQQYALLGPITHISEQGFYLYSGAGISLKISKWLSTYVDLGFKGYHMSLNGLDINPHGINLRIGATF